MKILKIVAISQIMGPIDMVRRLHRRAVPKVGTKYALGKRKTKMRIHRSSKKLKAKMNRVSTNCYHSRIINNKCKRWLKSTTISGGTRL